jgi:hypothetical protein
LENSYPEDLKINQEDLQEIKFLLADCSLKEAKKRYCSDEDLFVVDIGKIIKDLGYDINSLTKESEFVINYSIQKKITQGIYSTKCNGILVVHKNISESFVQNLEYFLEDLGKDISYTIENV